MKAKSDKWNRIDVLPIVHSLTMDVIIHAPTLLESHTHPAPDDNVQSRPFLCDRIRQDALETKKQTLQLPNTPMIDWRGLVNYRSLVSWTRMAHELIWEHMFLGTELPVLEPGSALPQGSEPGDWLLLPPKQVQRIAAGDADIWVNPGGQAVLRWDYVSTHDVSNVRSMLYVHRRTGNFMMVRGFPNVPVILTVNAAHQPSAHTLLVEALTCGGEVVRRVGFHANQAPIHLATLAWLCKDTLASKGRISLQTELRFIGSRSHAPMCPVLWAPFTQRKPTRRVIKKMPRATVLLHEACFPPAILDVAMVEQVFRSDSSDDGVP